MRGYWSITIKEYMHLRRDPASLVIALLIPIIQLMLFGFAIDLDVRHIPMVVADHDHSRESRQFVRALVNTGYLDVWAEVPSVDDAYRALREGDAKAAVVIPPDFSRRLVSGQIPVVQALIDGSDSIVATRARATIAQLSSRPGSSGIETRTKVLFNPDMRSENYMIPGLIGVILQLVTVALTAFSIVREREQGTLEQLMVSPVSRLGLVLGKLTPYAVLAFVEMIAVLALGWLVFGVQVAGSVALLLVLSVPFIVAALGLGLLISTIARDQAQALQLTILVTLPSILLSGFVFPRETMPGIIYLLGLALPITHFLEILRGIIIRGAGFLDVWSSALSVTCIALILISFASLRFRKSIG